MNYKVGQYVRRRLCYGNNPDRKETGSLTCGIKPNDIRKVTGIKDMATTGSRIRVWVEGGVETGYCADWFELPKEANVKKLLEKLNEV